jgi:hypothetical protein
MATFHGSLQRVNGAYIYQGSFRVTEAATTVNGTGSFTIDNANQIAISLQPSGGQTQHHVFVRESS